MSTKPSTYLRIDGFSIPIEQIAKAFHLPNPKEEVTLCREVNSGTITAATYPENADSPGIDVGLEILDSPGQPDYVPVSRCEQTLLDDAGVRNYVYFRDSDSYIAYTDVDDRPQSAVESGGDLPASIVVSGDIGEGNTLHVIKENDFVQVEPML